MKQTIEKLLYEEESSALDFKSEQYKFIGATDDEKSELLKDILAFANAWRRTDAYIIIGVKEIKGGRSEIKGISDNIDDSILQQFVNKKTQRPIAFSYTAFEFEGKKIGIIKIDTQDRPIHLKKKYGKLKKDIVYLRHGSSTAIASPDEIAKMGASHDNENKKDPILVFGFASLEDNKKYGDNLGIKTTSINISNESDIPSFGVSNTNLGMISNLNLDFFNNKNYYRDFANYIKNLHYVKKIDFFIFNNSGVLANDVSIELRINNLKDSLTVFEESDFPSKPIKDSRHNIYDGIFKKNTKLSVNQINNQWLITYGFKKVKAKQTLFTDNSIYIGASSNTSIKLDFEIYSDNLSEPTNGSLSLQISVENKTITDKQIVEISEKDYF